MKHTSFECWIQQNMVVLKNINFAKNDRWILNFRCKITWAMYAPWNIYVNWVRADKVSEFVMCAMSKAINSWRNLVICNECRGWVGLCLSIWRHHDLDVYRLHFSNQLNSNPRQSTVVVTSLNASFYWTAPNEFCKLAKWCAFNANASAAASAFFFSFTSLSFRIQLALQLSLLYSYVNKAVLEAKSRQ